jgi:hypothetical protein
VLSTTASVATSAASRSKGGPTDASVAPRGRVCCPRGRVCRPPWPRLSPLRPRLSPSVAASVTPKAASVALRGRVCRPPWPRLSPPVAASVVVSVVDHPALKRSYLLAPDSNFDDLRHFGKLTQRATQPTKALNPVHNGSKQYFTLRAIIVSGEHRKSFLSSPS